MTEGAAASALELRVLMDRLPGVVVPCLCCGGRGSYLVHGDGVCIHVQCERCGASGEQPAGAVRDMLSAPDVGDRAI